jgi:hypothetical protein
MNGPPLCEAVVSSTHNHPRTMRERSKTDLDPTGIRQAPSLVKQKPPSPTAPQFPLIYDSIGLAI